MIELNQTTMIVALIVAAILGYVYLAKEGFYAGNYGLANLIPGVDEDDMWGKHMLWRQAGKLDRNTTWRLKEHERKRDYCHQASANSCRIPVVNSNVCWLNEYQNCNYEMKPGDNGKYRQCTNNNLNVPNNLPCECGNRGYDVCLPKNRLSEACYSSKFNKCMAG